MDTELDNEDFDKFEGLASYIKEKETTYEETCTKRLLNALGLNEKTHLMKSMCEERTGEARLALAWLNEVCPEFPVKLAARRIPFVHEITLAKLFKSFTKTTIFKEYLAYLSEMDEDYTGCCGIIFNWPSIGSMVLHDYFAQNRVSTPDTYLVKQAGNRVCILESLSAFVERIRADIGKFSN